MTATSERRASDAATWLLLVAGGIGLTLLARRLHLRVGVPGAPFTGEYRFKVEVGTVLAPGVAIAVLAAVRAGVAERLGWRRLLLASYGAALAWSLALAVVDGGNGLAFPIANGDEYLRDLPAAGADPVAFVRHFVESTGHYSVATRTHPPAPVLLLWLLRKLGVARPSTIGVVVTALGCVTVPAVAVAMRSLCGEAAARRLLPALVLAPYAVWVAVSMDGVTAALCAVSVALGVVGSEPGRRPWWALASGLVLGVAALFSYAVGWIAATLLVVCFVRRRALAIAFVGAGALVPLALARLAGFVWPDGLTAAQADWSVRVGPHRSWALWALLDLVVLVIACGPHVVTAARRVRRTPGWPFLVGALVGVGFAIASGLARGEVERSWLPFFPWLLVPVTGTDDDGEPARPSLVLLALGAGAAVVIESVLRSAW
ncbi:MAG TPA: hypothetical protein VFQ85_03300 [Mycobacteriales bacterium]|jgi:hypothetical protein|nr:hypothetical protein [Mycobacteriales bacterium]